MNTMNKNKPRKSFAFALLAIALMMLTPFAFAEQIHSTDSELDSNDDEETPDIDQNQMTMEQVNSLTFPELEISGIESYVAKLTE
jgi:hypothetical protein